MFYSRKIPRTRDGTLDFGRSKPVDYSFLDHVGCQPSMDSLKRTASVPLSASAQAPPVKMSRLSPAQRYISAELYRRLSQDEPKPPKPSSSGTGSKKSESEKRYCKICEKEAQFLCSGCRNSWYCSQKCQVRRGYIIYEMSLDVALILDDYQFAYFCIKIGFSVTTGLLYGSE